MTIYTVGDPEPEVSWYKDDVPIKPRRGDKRIKADWDMKQDLNILTIIEATKEDEGTYTVIAENKFGSFKFSVTVLVGRPEGAEIIKTTESKKSVTVVEETVVDGKVVERTVKEDVSETEPETVVETISAVSEATPTETTVTEKTVTKKTSEEAVHIKGSKDKLAESASALQIVSIEGSEPESDTDEEGKAPKFVQAPEPVFVNFGETIRLTCKVEGGHKCLLKLFCLNVMHSTCMAFTYIRYNLFLKEILHCICSALSATTKSIL